MIAVGPNCAHSTAVRLVQSGQNEVFESDRDGEGEIMEVRGIDSSFNVRACGRI